MSFRLRGAESSVSFASVYPGSLKALDREDAVVEHYIEQHRAEVEAAARAMAK
jgi:hypothetical protein